MGRRTDFALSILNGTVGQFLHQSQNALSIPMTLMRDGVPLSLDRESLRRSLPNATPRVAVLVHGLMTNESVWQFPEGGDYGSFLARDAAFTPLYVRYNSGIAIADNGAALARLLEDLVSAYPVPIQEVVLIGYSMGGLVVRNACHVATEQHHGWLAHVRRSIYVGTPHRGSPFERGGKLVTKVLGAIDDPYARLIARIADLRSDGIKDLGDPKHPVPLLPTMQHFLVAGSLSTNFFVASFFGDALVPVSSGSDGHCASPETFALPPSHVKVVAGAGHIALAHHPDVYTHIRAWCEA